MDRDNLSRVVNVLSDGRFHGARFKSLGKPQSIGETRMHPHKRKVEIVGLKKLEVIATWVAPGRITMCGV